jgi:hypothetical protein
METVWSSSKANKITIGPSNPTPRYILKTTENKDSNRYLYAPMFTGKLFTTPEGGKNLMNRYTKCGTTTDNRVLSHKKEKVHG